MAAPAVSKNTWTLDEWYGQAVAGDADYVGISAYEAWGDNDYGQLGLNDRNDRSSPTQVSSDSTWDVSKLVQAGQYSLAIKTDGTLWTWGYNLNGELAQNDRNARSSPTQVGTATDWVEPAQQIASQTTGAAFRENSSPGTGSLWAWGKNYFGAMGQNQSPSTQAAYSSPVQIPTGDGTYWLTASLTYSGCFATRSNGTGWVWGDNSNGRLGLNETQFASRSSPTVIPGSWTKGYFNNASTCFGFRPGNNLWSWGYHGRGTLGQNDVQSKSSPVQIPGDWNQATGKFSSYWRAVGAIQGDGSLWVWGWNSVGELGLNESGAWGNAGSRSSPTQLGTDTNWSTIMTGKQIMVGTKTDGTIWSWGYNAQGELGQGDRTQYSSPVQVPGTWSSSGKAGTKVSGALANI